MRHASTPAFCSGLMLRKTTWLGLGIGLGLGLGVNNWYG